jgi:hypothetical protein
VYGSPRARGTFTFQQIQSVVDEARKIGTIEWIYFEGGEPFLFYPLLVESITIARSRGFKVGVVTNAYFATSEEDAELWLKPLYELGVADLSLSDDAFHCEDEENSPAKRALHAAKKLGMPVGSICIEKPTIEMDIDTEHDKGKPIVGGDVMFRGRAAEKLVGGLPRREWEEFTECPHEDLVYPERVHLDAYGNVHLCQGLSLGNMWKTPLSTLVKNYSADAHPICKYLVEGGPALLAKEYNVPHESGYVDACHLCYHTRLSLIERFPQFLAPRQVYGLE